MSVKNLCVIIVFASLFLSCSKKDTANVQLNLYLDGPLTSAEDKKMPKEVLDLLAPRACGETNTLIDLTIYRYDFSPVQSENITIPLSRANQMRETMGFLAFEHYATDFKENSSKFPNAAIFHKEGEAAVTDINSVVSGADLTFLCCGFFPEESSDEHRMQSNYDLMVQELNDSLCSQTMDRTFNFIYSSVPADGIPPPPPPPLPDNNIAMVFDQIGNSEIDPEERLNTVPEVLGLFSPSAAVIVEETGGTAFEPAPIETYLEKIALFRSLEQIEILDAKTNAEGLCFEVRLREHHKGIVQ